MPDKTHDDATDGPTGEGRRDQLVLTPEMSVPSSPRQVPDVAQVPEGAGTGTIADEAALRAMVAGIVREELRGAIGTDATAKIRTLVRREIRKALALRDID